jgi:hypothetical protein
MSTLIARYRKSLCSPALAIEANKQHVFTKDLGGYEWRNARNFELNVPPHPVFEKADRATVVEQETTIHEMVLVMLTVTLAG